MSMAYACKAAASASHLPRQLRLVCRTDSLSALRSAVDHGANSIRLIWRTRDQPNRGHPEFQRAGLRRAVQYARRHNCNVSLEVSPACIAPDAMGALLTRALDAGIHEIVLSSQKLALYLRVHHPALELQLIADESLSNRRALTLLRVQLGIPRVTVPPGLSLALLRELSDIPGMEIEVPVIFPGYAFATGIDNRKPAAMSPADAVSCSDGTPACNDSVFQGLPVDPLEALPHLHLLAATGAFGLLVETAGHSPARVAQLTGSWRSALDRLHQGSTRLARP